MLSDGMSEPTLQSGCRPPNERHWHESRVRNPCPSRPGRRCRANRRPGRRGQRCGALVVMARGRNQPTGRVSAADEKPSHDRSAEKPRTVRTVRGFLLLQIAMFLVLVTIHFGLLIGGYGHPAAATTESVIAVVLVLGLL